MNTHHFVNLLTEPTPPDTLLLLPLLQSGTQPTLPAPCLHVTATSGKLTFCNATTDESCAACHRPICKQHQHPRFTSLLDEHSSLGSPALHFVCEACAVLPSHVLWLTQALRLSLNEQIEDCQTASPTSELLAVRSYIEQRAPHLEILGVVYSGTRPLLSVRDTAALDIVVAFGSLADLIGYLHYVPGAQTQQEVLHEF